MSKLRKVLSFDVGIINLAYCLLEIDDSEKKFAIKKWGLINLANGRSTCNFIKNNGEICDNVASHTIKLNKKIIINIISIFELFILQTFIIIFLILYKLFY